MRPGASAPIGVVSKLMDMHAPLSRGVVALDLIGDCGWGGLVGLLKGDGSTHGGVSANNCHCWEVTC